MNMRIVWMSLMVAVCIGAASAFAQEASQPAKGDPIPAAQEQPASLEPTARLRISDKEMNKLAVKKVAPEYPQIARTNRVQGAVVMQVFISKTGEVADVKVISGDGWLAPAAVKAVKQWRYKPYLLKGQPVEVETQITLNFKLH